MVSKKLEILLPKQDSSSWDIDMEFLDKLKTEVTIPITGVIVTIAYLLITR